MIDDPARTAGGTLGDYAYRANRQRPLSEVLKDIIGNVQDIVRSEVRLAKAELREEASRSLNGAKLLGIGAGLGFFAAAFVLTAVALVLSRVMPAWAATLLLGAVLGAAGWSMMAKGREKLTVPRPQRTIHNLKENVEWMKNQTK